MARGQQRGVGSLTVWMIVFVALWLTSTVFLVILYTGLEDLSDKKLVLERDNARLISPTEQNSVELFSSARKEGPTLVGLLVQARDGIATLATGDDTGDPSADDPIVTAVRTELDQFLRTIRSDRIVGEPQRYEDVSYHKALTMLYEAFGAEYARRRDAEERLEELGTEVDMLVKGNARQKTDFDKRAKELSDQLIDVEADRGRYRAERDEQIAELERGFDERRAQNDADLTRERQRNAALDGQIAQLQRRFADYRERLGELLIGPEELSTARRPDGRILTAIPGDEIVYIDLGRKDMLTLGLQFAVYSAETGIPADGQGKAQIEVASISDSSAECKIVNIVGHDVILEGDLVANPVYDPNRSLSFMVLGEFDLDYDGVPDMDGARAIESMITDWGGTLCTELTALADFVVLGGPPRRPKSAADTSLEQGGQLKAMRLGYDRYVEMVALARSLSVPILSQQVFLNFLGYSGRYAGR